LNRFEDEGGKGCGIRMPGSNVIGEVLDFKIESGSIRGYANHFIEAGFGYREARGIGEFGIRKRAAVAGC
jgi:hypothetical protein